MPAAPARRVAWFPLGVLLILVAAALWRGLVAVNLPVIAKDGVTFCWYARDLGASGLNFLRSESAHQHPLFPALVLGVQRAAAGLGAPDTPRTWQYSGQLVAGLAGLVVIALAGALAARLIRRLELPLNARLAALLAMAFAAVLDLNVWLSADVMSDQLHLAFYLGAVFVLLELATARAALLVGLLSGLAFLTREEGFVPALAAVFALLMARRHARAAGQIAPSHRGLAARAVLVLAGFLVCAAPYWAVVGQFSGKKNVFDWLRGEATAHQDVPENGVSDRPCDALMCAKLETVDLPWYAVLPQALYKLLRAGRVVIPVLALPALLSLRRRLLAPPLAGYTACLAGHFTLTLLLLAHYGYLDPRHMLVVVMLLAPLAGMQLSRLVSLLLDLRRRRAAAVLIAVFLLPSALYALRMPNRQDAFLARAADWLIGHDPHRAGRRLVCSQSGRRIAFYAGLRAEPWSEDPNDPALPVALRDPAAGYFAIELEAPAQEDFERRGNRALLECLMNDPTVAGNLRCVHVEPAPDGVELHLFAIGQPPAAPAPDVSSRPGASATQSVLPAPTE
ncbi:MAG: hypothetical protein AB1716_14135 [Planctomycetota bacterium]